MFRISLPSTLFIHDLRLALLSYVCAKQAHKQLIVRLESHDDTALEMLLLFGISYQHLYYQSDNFKYHLQFASTLLDKKKAFICFCETDASPYDGGCETLRSEEILNTPKPFVIRMKKEDPSSDSFVIMHTDKYPTNVFASACDDMLQGVSSIIREETYVADAQKEAYIRTSIGYDEAIAYTHIPTLLCQGDESSVKQLLDQGFMPEAIVNYLLLLGNPTPTEIFTLTEAIEWFDIKAISPNSALFEMEKLCAINREHILRLDDMELSKRIGYACENVGKLAKLYTQEASTTHEIKQKIDAIFAKKEPMNDDKKEVLQLQNAILEAPYFETFDDFKAHLLNVSGLTEEHLSTLLRFWLSGSHNGPELALLYPLIKTYLKEIVR
jgi:glutamyl-tRNA synthetase